MTSPTAAEDAYWARIYARAQGPQVGILEWDDVLCPWCGTNCVDVLGEDAVTECEGCGKEFLCPDAKGNLVCIGLLSPADMAYLAWRENRDRS